MKTPSAFLALAVLTLGCCLATPSPSSAQPFGGWSSYGVGPFGWGGWGWRGYGYAPYGTNYIRPPAGYMSPNYTNYAAPVNVIEPIYVTTTTATGTPVTHGTHQQHAFIYVDVPAHATLFFDGTEMHEQGSRRVFQTPPLQPNATGYSYELTARWSENGKEHVDKRQVRVTPGGSTTVNFLSGHDHQPPAALQSGPPTGQVAVPARHPGDNK
jgi:uncharacterized protein (TIGR03000 family)